MKPTIAVPFIVLICAVKLGSGAEQVAAQGHLCPAVLTDLVPGLYGGIPTTDLAHVEIRRCSAEGGSMQVIAWKAKESKPSLVIDVARFTVGSLLMEGNVFVIVFPGPYDSIVVVTYSNGEPKLAFTDSTHDRIFLRTIRDAVEVVFDSENSSPKVKRFVVDEDQLSFVK